MDVRLKNKYQWFFEPPREASPFRPVPPPFSRFFGEAAKSNWRLVYLGGWVYLAMHRQVAQTADLANCKPAGCLGVSNFCKQTVAQRTPPIAPKHKGRPPPTKSWIHAPASFVEGLWKSGLDTSKHLINTKFERSLANNITEPHHGPAPFKEFLCRADRTIRLFTASTASPRASSVNVPSGRRSE